MEKRTKPYTISEMRVKLIKLESLAAKARANGGCRNDKSTITEVREVASMLTLDADSKEMSKLLKECLSAETLKAQSIQSIFDLSKPSGYAQRYDLFSIFMHCVREFQFYNFT